jgi:signal transduction histidine kinase
MTRCRRLSTAVLLFLAIAPWTASAQVQQLTQARSRTVIDGVVAVSDVKLPYHWDRRNHGRSGTAEFDIPIALETSVDALYGLYFRRLGNAYEIYLNGRLLQRNGDLAQTDSSDFAKAPRYVAIPHYLVRQTNLLQVRIRADGGRRGGVAEPLFGPEAEIRSVFEREQRWRVEGSLAVVVLSLFVGVGAFVLWLTQVDASEPAHRGRDGLYLFAALAEMSWAVRVADAIIEQPPVSWTWWGTIQTCVLAIWLSSAVIFCMKLAGWDKGIHGPRLERCLLGFVLVGSLCGFASFQFDRTWVLTGWFIVTAILFASFCGVFIFSAWRSGNTMHRIVAIPLAINVVVGIRDAMVFRLAESYGDNTYIRYTSVLFGLVLGYVLLTRFQAATTQARELMRDLEAKVADREAELKRSYERLEQVARAQERAMERATILRDMHDGVGSHITSAIRQLESGKATSSGVLDTLRDSLDHLKLSIDAMHLPPGDVGALLANLRYRLDPRFAASDVKLEWAVGLVQVLPRLEAGAMRHLQFILFEALSNVLQHARATNLSIQACDDPAGVVVRLVDNGVGFEPCAPFRKGLLSMQERATAIGAQLAVRSSAEGTMVEISIPA